MVSPPERRGVDTTSHDEGVISDEEMLRRIAVYGEAARLETLIEAIKLVEEELNNNMGGYVRTQAQASGIGFMKIRRGLLEEELKLVKEEISRIQEERAQRFAEQLQRLNK